MLDGVRAAVADDHVGVPGDDRLDQAQDVRPAVLVVGVGVDDDVGAELQRGVQTGLEARGQALVVRQADDVVDAVRAGDLDRAVGGAVVDDEPLDRVEPGTSRGRSASVAGRVSSSFRQGIWTMSFISRRRRGGRANHGPPHPALHLPQVSQGTRSRVTSPPEHDPVSPPGRRRRPRILDGGTPHAAHRHRSPPPRARARARRARARQGQPQPARRGRAGPRRRGHRRGLARPSSAARTPRSGRSAPRRGADLRGATLYVSLEPCCHQGRQPPCTDAILAAGISRVVVASDDPTEKATGRGLGILRDEGVEVTIADGEPRPRAARLRQPGLPQARAHRAALGPLQVGDDARREGRDRDRRLPVDLERGQPPLRPPLARGGRRRRRRDRHRAGRRPAADPARGRRPPPAAPGRLRLHRAPAGGLQAREGRRPRSR